MLTRLCWFLLNVVRAEIFLRFPQVGSPDLDSIRVTVVIKYEPRHEKTCLQGLHPGKTQTGLLR